MGTILTMGVCKFIASIPAGVAPDGVKPPAPPYVGVIEICDAPDGVKLGVCWDGVCGATLVDGVSSHLDFFFAAAAAAAAAEAAFEFNAADLEITAPERSSSARSICGVSAQPDICGVSPV